MGSVFFRNVHTENYPAKAALSSDKGGGNRPIKAAFSAAQKHRETKNARFLREKCRKPVKKIANSKKTYAEKVQKSGKYATIVIYT